MLKQIQKYNKALTGFVVAFVAALVAEINTGTNLDSKSLLLALGTALVTSYGVFQVPNRS